MHRATATAALLILSVFPGASPAHAQRASATPPKAASLAPTDAWDTFSADITLRRSRVNADGQPIGDSAVAHRYHWERSSASGHWQTTMTLAPADAQSLRTVHGNAAIDDRLLIARIVDDEDGSGPRIYNKRGDLLRAPGRLDELLPATPGSDRERPARQPAAKAAGQQPRGVPSPSQWADNHFIKRSGHDARRLALQRRHGRPTGQVRGLDRYVTTNADRTEETLVDRQLQLPVETNVVREGRLISHKTMSYEDAAGDLVVRRRVHTERVVSPQTGERAIVELEFTNTRLEQRR
jgi:hypothetical protein